MFHDRKSLIVALLLTTTVLSGCDSIRDFFGSPRTVPDGASVKFDNPHTPPLNPGGSGDATLPGADGGTSMGARHVPVENLQAAGAAQAPTSSNAPITPVTAAIPTQSAVAPAPAATPSAYPTLASVPANPTYPAKTQNATDMNGLTADRDLSESMQHELVSNPNATVMTSPTTGALVPNPENAMMPAASVPPAMPATPSASVSVPPVAASAAASPNAPLPATQTPPAAQSDSGFNHWLHNMFSSNTDASSGVRKSVDSNAEATSAPVAVSPAPVTVSPPAPVSISTPAPVTATSESQQPMASSAPLQLHPPAAMANEPAVDNPSIIMSTPVTPAPIASAPVMSAPAQQSMTSSQPVHLNPPQETTGSDTNASPFGGTSSPASEAAAEPVILTPPSEATAAPSATPQYLSDSRYAARRAHVPSDDDAPGSY